MCVCRGSVTSSDWLFEFVVLLLIRAFGASCRLDATPSPLRKYQLQAHMTLIHKLPNNYEQLHKIISTCSFVVCWWYRMKFSYTLFQSNILNSIVFYLWIVWLVCMSMYLYIAQYTIHDIQHTLCTRTTMPKYLFRLHICLSVLSIYANPAGEYTAHFGWFKHANLCVIDGLKMICTAFSGGCRFQISNEF